jgi:hypothetical protein
MSMPATPSLRAKPCRSACDHRRGVVPGIIGLAIGYLRQARMVGDYDVNTFLVPVDPTGDEAPRFQPGMTVWLGPRQN